MFEESKIANDNDDDDDDDDDDINKTDSKYNLTKMLQRFRAAIFQRQERFR